MNNVKRILFFITLAAFFQCSNNKRESDTEKVPSEFLQFSGFPDTLFSGICWAQTLEGAKEKLVQANYKLVDSSGNWRYKNDEDSIEVILPFTGKLSSVKIYLMAQKHQLNRNKLTMILKNKADSFEFSEGFDVYTYEKVENQFKASCFSLDGGIKITLELLNKI